MHKKLGCCQWNFPTMAPPPARISAELTHGNAIGQQYTVGWANIQSDCRANWFTAPNRNPVGRSVVRVNYDIEVREVQGTLTENNAKLVIRDQVWFEIKTDSEAPTDLDTQPNKQNKIEHHIFNQKQMELKSFHDSTYGVFVI